MLGLGLAISLKFSSHWSLRQARFIPLTSRRMGDWPLSTPCKLRCVLHRPALTCLALSPGRARFGLIASATHSLSLHKRAVHLSSADQLLLYTYSLRIQYPYLTFSSACFRFRATPNPRSLNQRTGPLEVYKHPWPHLVPARLALKRSRTEFFV